jgi:hypothetical protein
VEKLKLRTWMILAMYWKFGITSIKHFEDLIFLIHQHKKGKQLLKNREIKDYFHFNL